MALLSKKVMNFSYGMGAAVVIVGALFKITHMELGPLNGNNMLTVGLLVEALIFAISAFEPVDEDLDWTRVYPELGGGEPRAMQVAGNVGVTGTVATTSIGGSQQQAPAVQTRSAAPAYAAARVVDLASNPLKVIAEEKWVTLFNNGHDAWSEWRRTGFPVLAPATSAINGGVIPTRIPYPLEEANYNTTKYNEAVTRLVPAVDKNTSKFWWEV